MGNNNLEMSNFIINQPDYYHEVQSKTLDERIESIRMDKTDEIKIRNDHAKKVIKDRVLGLFSCGDLIGTLLDWSDEVNEEITNSKKNVLLETYFNKVEQQENSVSNLKNFLGKPHGYTLFNKIIQILDNNPPDLNLIDILANSLNIIISKGEFEEYFEEHKYVLSQIETLPIQSLIILRDYMNYPYFGCQSGMYNGEIFEGEWVNEFSKQYSIYKNIRSKKKENRIMHSIKRLAADGYLIAIKSDKEMQCKLTSIGAELVKYISG